ncbi:hypothetical protein GCM10026983_23350 [Gracilibacillus alcaliphilus]
MNKLSNFAVYFTFLQFFGIIVGHEYRTTISNNNWRINVYDCVFK